MNLPPILTPDQRLRIFVSSTLEELAEERAAARRAAEQLRLTPVMFAMGTRPASCSPPSGPARHPPRSLYVAYLHQSQVFVGIYGEQYGWIAPDLGMSGVEDELRHADELPLLVVAGSAAQAKTRTERGEALMASIGLSNHHTEAAGRLPHKVSIPKLQTLLVPLPELYDRLSEGATGPLTVVRGPAAAGKTALVAAWIASELPPGLVAWLTLDEQDTEPVTFWKLVVEALRRHGVNLPAEMRCPSEPGSLFLRFLEELAAALGYHREPVVLVLDHFDAVTDPRVLRQLGLLLRKAAPELRLVVTTRRPPPGVLGRRRLTVAV